jgi:hypothetical protein
MAEKYDAHVADQQRWKHERREAFRKTLRALPGYPWLPCPICKGTESCDHIGAERARASIPGLVFPDETTIQ